MPRYTTKPEDLADLFNDTNNHVANLTRKSHALGILTELVQHICPDLPTGSFRLANVKSNTIVIEAKSPAWGQRLQFERNTILREINNSTQYNYQRIDIKVVPFETAAPITQEPIKPKKQMSQKVANQLVEMANSAPESLKQKILKLAKHAK